MNVFTYFKDLFNKGSPTKAERDLALIRDLIFPRNVSQVDPKGVTFMVDYSIDANLEGVLGDLNEGYVDSIAISNLERCHARLAEVRKVLNVEPWLHPDAKYYIVDPTRAEDPEVQAGDDKALN